MEENIENTSAQKSSESLKPLKKRSKFLNKEKIFKLIIFFLLLAVIFAAAVLWRTLEQSQQKMHENTQALQALFKQQISEQNNLKNKIFLLDQQLIQQKSNFAQENARLLLRINQSSVNQKSSKITEIFDLVRTANLVLTAEHNIPGALLLLKQAESQLNLISDSQDVFLADFHRQLLKNIAFLQNMPVLDLVALTAKFSALRDQTLSLSILVEPKPNTSIVQNTPQEARKKWWQRAWNNIKASLQQLVIVRHREDKMPALLAPEEQIYLQENLQLLLMQAQWALINHQSSLYQQTLKQARLWVEKYYVQNAANTQSFLKDLQFLIQQPVSPVLPDLLSSMPQER